MKHRDHIVIGLALLIIVLTFIMAPPVNFPQKSILSIEEGLTLDETAKFLGDESIIRHPALFKLTVKILSGDKGVKAGDYFFEEPISTVTAAHRIISASYGLDPIRITIPEGVSNITVAQLLHTKLPSFDENYFLEAAGEYEGYLFPETYFFLPNSGTHLILAKMRQTFDEKTADLSEQIEQSDHTLEEIVIMASLLEAEARRSDTREKIAGILWKRLDIGMALQVDAVFPYIMGKNSFELTLDDLKFDSPYNTYLYPGLPIGPINNPSLSSISAALNPQESEYLFYLSDLSGNMHYAVTFDGHKVNKARYLR